MLWPSFGRGPGFAGWIVAVAAVLLAVSWALKLRDIQHLQWQVALTEGKLKSAQDLWRNYPPMEPEKRGDLERSQERLFRSLPREKEIPPLYEEISRLAREFNLSEVTIGTEDQAVKPGAEKGASPAAPPRVAPAQAAAPSPGPSEDSGPIGSFAVKVSFSGDYREIAYFLEALRTIPRLVTVQSLQMRRRVPVVSAEIVLRSYYQRGALPRGTK